MEYRIKHYQHGAPQDVSCRTHVFTVAIQARGRVKLAVVLEGYLGVVNIPLGFFYGVFFFDSCIVV